MSVSGRGQRVVLVTGAARGIGAAVARRFGEAGDLVFGADVLEAESKPDYTLVYCDVAEEGAVEALVGRVLDAHGRIDVLVNVAGVVLVKPLEETDGRTTAAWSTSTSVAPSCCASTASLQ